MKVQINRRDFAEVSNISHLQLREGKVYVHLKSGYPKILKARVGLDNFLLRLVNAQCTPQQIQEFKNGTQN